tara:strand:- start:360 stop:476 length:117 start_codon:yes stop_codon:yes gene_type:complete
MTYFFASVSEAIQIEAALKFCAGLLYFVRKGDNILFVE